MFYSSDPVFQKPQRTEENRENYSFGPQTEAKCQVSSMVKQGQQSPVVSLPFRLYWQLCDPTVWMTIISQSPCCVPPVSQTYSQTKKLCTEIPTTKVDVKINYSTRLKRELLIWTLHFCIALSDSDSNTTAFHFVPFCAQFNGTLAGRRIHVCCKTDTEKRYEKKKKVTASSNLKAEL